MHQLTLPRVLLLVAACHCLNAVPAAAEAPADASLAELRVTVVTEKPGLPSFVPTEVAADITINGIIVGVSPYAEQLAPGAYTVEVWVDGRVIHSQSVTANAGQAYAVSAKIVVPLSPAERDALDAAARAKAQAAFDAEHAVWKTAHKAWDEKTRAQRSRKHGHVGLGTPALVLGLGMVVAGGVCLGNAKSYDEAARDSQAKWEIATDPHQIEVYADYVEKNQDQRDLLNGWGIGLLITGGLATATGILLLATTPRVERAPTEPRVRPFATATSVGAALTASF